MLKNLKKDLRSAFKEIDKKKRSTAISEIENQCKEMFAEDEAVTENQAMSSIKIFRKRYSENCNFKRKEKN